MAVTLPIINGSSGTWGTILNTAITDIDTRLTTASDKNTTQDTNLTALTTRVTTIENTKTVGMMAVSTSSTRPAASVGLMGLETDTGYMYYVASINGTPTRVPWPGSYLVRCRQTSSQNIPADGVGTAITFQASDVNRLGGWSSGSRFTAPVAGNYEFNGAVAFGPNATGYRMVSWAFRGTQANSSRIMGPANTGAATIVNARQQMFPMAAGDWVELWGTQSSGAVLATEVSTTLYQSSMLVKYNGYYGT